MKHRFIKAKAAARLFSVIFALCLSLSFFVPVFSAAVKVPVFFQTPENTVFIAGTSGFLKAGAALFNDTSTQLRYTLQVLRGDSFVSEDSYTLQRSSALANIKVQTGKGGGLMSSFGVYTVRIRATATDEYGNESSGYSPAFEIEVLPAFIKELSADEKVSYGEAFKVTAQINPCHENRQDVRYLWTVSDNGTSFSVNEGDIYKGITFTGTGTSVLQTEGTPEGFFTLGFSLTVAPDGVQKQESSPKIFVDYRREKTVGFSLGEGGMKHFGADGQYTVGWLRANGDVYFFGEDGYMMTGEAVIEGKKCFFSFDGKLISGFMRTPLGLKYYENGQLLSGWHTLFDGVTYYFEEFSGYMTAKKDTQGRLYCFTDYGALTYRTVY